MKRIIVLMLAFLLPGSANSLGWFHITRSYVQQLGLGSYRVRVEVDWGGETFDPAVGAPADGVPASPYPYYTGSATPGLFQFGLSSIGTVYNPYYSFHPTDEVSFSPDPSPSWSAVYYRGFGSFGPNPVFGYDFNYIGPQVTEFSLSFSSSLWWSAPWQEPDGPYGAYVLAEEYFGNTFTAAVVPEPATIALFGIGLVGLGTGRAWRGKRR